MANEVTPKRNVKTESYGVLEEVDITVKVPKPEAQIFTPKMKTMYENLTALKSFVPELFKDIPR